MPEKKPKKTLKRVLALCGAAFLVLLYILTFIFSLLKGEYAYSLFKASVAATFIIPFLIYAYLMIIKWIKKDI